MNNQEITVGELFDINDELVNKVSISKSFLKPKDTKPLTDKDLEIFKGFKENKKRT